MYGSSFFAAGRLSDSPDRCVYETDVLERASDGGYYAWLTVNMQCNAYGESPDEAIRNLEESMNEIIDEMYMVEDFV